MQGTAQLAATARSNGTPDVRSHATGSPVSAATAVISNGRTGQSCSGRRRVRDQMYGSSATTSASSARLPTAARICAGVRVSSFSNAYA